MHASGNEYQTGTERVGSWRIMNRADISGFGTESASKSRGSRIDYKDAGRIIAPIATILARSWRDLGGIDRRYDACAQHGDRELATSKRYLVSKLANTERITIFFTSLREMQDATRAITLRKLRDDSTSRRSWTRIRSLCDRNDRARLDRDDYVLDLSFARLISLDVS